MSTVISIGSNVGDRPAHLRSAVAGLPGVRAVSPVYETAPWGGVEQGDFLNAVVLAEAVLEPEQWLALAHRLEDAAGRERRVRWGPRTLDVDLIDVDGVRREDGHLTLPHPRAAERAFVLVPWLDIAPDAVLPGHGRVADLVAALDVSGVRRTDLAVAS